MKLPAGVLNGSAFFWGALMLAASCGRALSLLYGLTWNISPVPLLVVCALYCVTAIQRVSLGGLPQIVRTAQKRPLVGKY